MTLISSFDWLILVTLACQLIEVGGASSWQQKAEYDLGQLENSIRIALDESYANKVNDGGGCAVGGERWETTKEATKWVVELEQELRKRSHDLALADWNYITNLTDDNSKKYETIQTEYDQWWASLIDKARGYVGGTFSEDQAQVGSAGAVRRGQGGVLCNSTTTRLLRMIVFSNKVPMAKNPETTKSINHLVNQMSSIYSTATVSRNGNTLHLDPELTQLMSTSRDHEELRWAWLAWHNASGPPVRSLYIRLVELMNEAATDNGLKDVGEAWQISDYETLELENIMDDLYKQVKPFYQQLHAYVRYKLAARYPGAEFSEDGLIPAHLLGNMWAQQWDDIFDLVAPYPEVSASRDITGALKRHGYTVTDMFRTAERFFTSLGLEPMTDKFWARSVIEKPADSRPMECHGSAHDFYSNSDFRIKMCTTLTASDFQTVHHEMGHIEYFMQYRAQPTLYRTGANAAFHEAIGDTVALSVATPTHLQAIGLIDQSQGSVQSDDLEYKQQINYLMQMALQKVAFLPFSYITDKWRFAVFRGDITADKYNEGWWKLREKYQGLKAPVPRSEQDFDPGSKYHIPNNVPYSRYFLSFIGQFQFHEALCSLAGHGEKDLSMCDIYQSQAAGSRLKSVLSLGASRPWPEVMREFTGQSKFKVNSLLKYFKPLIGWLKRANRNNSMGWTSPD